MAHRVLLLLITVPFRPKKVSLALPAIIMSLTEKTLGSDTMKILLGYKVGNLDSVFGGVG